VSTSGKEARKSGQDIPFEEFVSHHRLRRRFTWLVKDRLVRLELSHRMSANTSPPVWSVWVVWGNDYATVEAAREAHAAALGS
jgi:hypothetical protein